MPVQNLRIGWLGFHQEGIPALRGLKESGIHLEAVITLDEAGVTQRSAIADYAGVVDGWDIPLHLIRNINDAASLGLLHSLRLDLLFVIGWSQILKRDALAAAKIGVVGAHASLLPHNRGSAPINWSLIRGEAVTGNTLIWLTEDVDAGRIIDQTGFPITPYDTCRTLYEKVAHTNHIMIQRLLPRLFAGEIPGRPQPVTDHPVLPRRRPSDGLIDWNHSSKDVYNFVRAMTRPYPGAFSFLEGQKWTIQACMLLPDTAAAAGNPGMILGPAFSPAPEACGLVVACKKGSIVVLELEGPGGIILKGQALSNAPWTGKVWTNE